MAEKQKTQFHDCKDEKEVDAFLEKVEAGDALQFRRTGFYHHWGICTGRNKEGEVEVAHVTAPEDTSALGAAMAACGCAAKETCGKFLENIGKPFKESLRYVMSKQNFVRVNNSMDKHFPPFKVDVMLERVKMTLRDDGWKCYHFALNNCEHYVNYCRNGNRVSLQSIEKGRLTLSYLAAGAKRVAECAPTPEISCVAAAAGTVLTLVEEYVGKKESRFRGKMEEKTKEGEDSIKDKIPDL